MPKSVVGILRKRWGSPSTRIWHTGEGAQILRELMEASRLILRHHPVNQERVNAGLKPVKLLVALGPE